MFDKAQRTVRIKWVRSGIGFSCRQKDIVRSLGLKKLNQEVERPDTAQIRGLVAKVPHLVKIVEAASKPAWWSVPEYTIYPREVATTEQAGAPTESAAAETEKTEARALQGVTVAQAVSVDQEQPAEAPAVPEAAAETPEDLAAPEKEESADASGKKSVKPGTEASPEKGKPGV